MKVYVVIKHSEYTPSNIKEIYDNKYFANITRDTLNKEIENELDNDNLENIDYRYSVEEYKVKERSNKEKFSL